MDFHTLGLAPRLADLVEAQGMSAPTPIQAEAIPHVFSGHDVMGLAQTGTGKTAAFALPLIQALTKTGTKPSSGRVACLILAPTRELAGQIAETFRQFIKGSHLKVSLVVGGASLARQTKMLSKGTHVLVATPGRLIDLLDRKALDLRETRYLVLDEADQMLDMGFIHALRRIAPLLPTDRQTLMFSATMPKHMAELSGAYLTDPVRIEVARPGLAADAIEQSVHFVPQADKVRLLTDFLQRNGRARSLVFARTKHGAEKLMKALVAAGVSAGSVHGNKSQGQRDRAINALKSGKIDVLVATDVAARGLDIKGIEHVYNFDLPDVAENYVHRIGRTARAGASGCAVAFCAAHEMASLKAIEKVMAQTIPVAGGKAWGNDKASKPKKTQKRRPRRRKGGNGGYRMAA